MPELTCRVPAARDARQLCTRQRPRRLDELAMVHPPGRPPAHAVIEPDRGEKRHEEEGRQRGQRAQVAGAELAHDWWSRALLRLLGAEDHPHHQRPPPRSTTIRRHRRSSAVQGYRADASRARSPQGSCGSSRMTRGSSGRPSTALSCAMVGKLVTLGHGPLSGGGARPIANPATGRVADAPADGHGSAAPDGDVRQDGRGCRGTAPSHG